MDYGSINELLDNLPNGNCVFKDIIPLMLCIDEGKRIDLRGLRDALKRYCNHSTSIIMDN